MLVVSREDLYLLAFLGRSLYIYLRIGSKLKNKERFMHQNKKTCIVAQLAELHQVFTLNL